MDISTNIHGYTHGYPQKICGYGYGWQISYPWQAWVVVLFAIPAMTFSTQYNCWELSGDG